MGMMMVWKRWTMRSDGDGRKKAKDGHLAEGNDGKYI